MSYVFRLLGMPAERAIYFVNVFNDFLEANYLRIYWADFYDLLTKW